MAYLTQVQETQSRSTCADCPKFKDYNESNGRGWCTLFEHQARQHHTLTSDCQQQLESEQLQELLDQYQAYLKPVINGFPGRDVYKQLPQLGYERIGYVSQNLVGWFALNQHGLTVADKLPSQNEALGALLKSFKPNKSVNYRSPLEKESTSYLDDIEQELEQVEDIPHSEYEPGQIVKVIDEGEDHTEWASFVVVGARLNQDRFRSTESYQVSSRQGIGCRVSGLGINSSPHPTPQHLPPSYLEPNWYYLLASVDRPLSAMFWAKEDEICHAHQSELIETAEVF